MLDIKNQPFVSVIIPFYNAHEHLRETVESVISQDYSNWEIVIANDGSKPPSIEEVLIGLSPPNVRIVNHETNKGLPIARNTAFYESKGEFVLPLDADDLISPSFLTETVKVLIEDPECSAVFTQVQMFGEMDLVWVPEADMVKLMCGMPIQSTVLFRRAVFDGVGGYNTTIRNAPDVDFWIRVLAKGFKLRRVEKPLYLYRKLVESLSTEGQLTEVVDLAKANEELYVDNLDLVFQNEKEKFERIVLDFEILKDGYAQLHEGYSNLRERYKDLKNQFSRKGKSCLSLPSEFDESEELKTALSVIPTQVLRNNAQEFDANWMEHLASIEREYFRLKDSYRIIHKQFKKLEQEYLQLHQQFDDAVEQLKKLGVRYQLRKALGLKQ